MKLLTSLVISLSLAAPLFAQEVPKPEKTQEELLKELHDLMKKTSDEMGKAEEKLTDTSRDKIKDDVTAAIIEKFQNDLKSGNIEDVPEGLRKYLKENKEKLAKQLGLSEDEVAALAESEDLKDWVKANSELLSKEFESKVALEELIIYQKIVENDLETTLDGQADSAQKISENIDKSLEAAHNLAGSGGKSKSDSVDNKQNAEGKPGQEPNQLQTPQKSPQGKPDDAQHEVDSTSEGYIPEPSQNDSKAFQAESNKKTTNTGNSSDEQPEPSKYKGFREAWQRTIKKKLDAWK